MGARCSTGLIAETCNENAPSAVLGCHVILSNKQKALIKDSWKVVSQNMKEFGVLFFLRYFQKYPDNKNFFSAFRDQEVEHLNGSIVLRAHGTIVLQTIMALLDNLDDPDTIKRQLYRVVGVHYDMGIRMVHYKDILSLLIEMLAEKNVDFEQFHYDTWRVVTALLLKSIGEIMGAIEAEYST